jgi:hypothetical protein
MWISKRALVTGSVALISAMSMALATGAFGSHGGRDDHGNRRGDDHRQGNDNRHHGAQLPSEALAPSLTTDPSFHGVAPGGAPWVLKRGDVELGRSGKLELRVRGLVIPTAPGNGTPGPVTTISASLYCGADSNTAAADTSAAAPLDSRGNARIEDRSFAVPDTCLAPVILVHPNGDATHYIAAEGWRP